jgi:hypothetical protein
MNKDPRSFLCLRLLANQGFQSWQEGESLLHRQGKRQTQSIATKAEPLTAQRQELLVYVQEGLTEKRLLLLRRYCIALYGRIDLGTGILRNMTAGGGGLQVYFSKDDAGKSFRVLTRRQEK